jgi:NADPH2:quinone reductase
MRAITYTRLGDPSVLELVDKPVPEPGAGEVRVRVLVSGVNPTDWKSRGGTFGGALTGATVPNHDGAGVVDAVGAGVTGFGVGDRVWVTLAGDGRPGGGTAQECTVVPAERVFALPEGAEVELGSQRRYPGRDAQDSRELRRLRFVKGPAYPSSRRWPHLRRTAMVNSG